MKQKTKKLYLQQKRRSLKKIIGSIDRPRLAVFRSHKHIYAQLIDDKYGQTLAFSSTVEKEIQTQFGGKVATKTASFLVGENLAKRAKQKNIERVIFDRGKRPYHGRIQKLAEGARNEGLIF